MCERQRIPALLYSKCYWVLKERVEIEVLTSEISAVLKTAPAASAAPVLTRTEFRLQVKMKQMEDAGIIPPIDEDTLMKQASSRFGMTFGATRTEDIPKPRQLQRLENDPELKKQAELSRTLWGSANASYLLRDGEAMKSVTKSDYVWDEDEIAYMKSLGEFDKVTHACNARSSQWSSTVNCPCPSWPFIS